MTTPQAPSPTVDAEFDPILSEVVYHYELTVNREMSRTVLNLSGSPIFVGAADFACACLDAKGNTLTNISWSLQMGYAIANTVRASLRRYGDDIHPGDMIFCNDPYEGGGLHASDVVIATPVFVDDELIMWVGVSAHVTDVGGAVPGSFSVSRMEVYGENIRFTPVKFYDRGEYKDDIVDAFLTNVRLPERVEIDLKAIMGANWLGRERVESLLAHYGADRIKAVHDWQLAQAENRMRERITTLPDGVYEGAAHMEHDGDEDIIYTVRARVIKDGEHLTVDFSDTDAQAPGVLNCTEIGSVGNVVAAIGTVVAPDIPFNEGLMKAVDIISPKGTLVNSIKPAPVSGATVYGSWFGTDAILEALNHALANSDETENRRTGPWGCWTWSFLHCTNQFGQGWVFIIFTGGAGGASALSFRDGEAAMCGIQTIDSFTANIEDYEGQSPVLMLNRRFAPDSGGPGRYRGGFALESLAIPWDGSAWHATTNHNRLTAPASTVSGGYPGSGSSVRLAAGIRDDIFEYWERGEAPPLDGYVAGATRFRTRSTGVSVEPEDGYYIRSTGGPGFGDPLTRETGMVGEDVRHGFVSVEQAGAAYGVVVDDTGTVDWEGTEELRSRIREERRSRKLTKDVLADGPADPDREAGVTAGRTQTLGEYLQLDERGTYVCRVCDHAFCSDRQNWRWFAAFSQEYVSPEALKVDIKPRPERDLVFRTYCCPSCGTQMETEVALPAEAPRWGFMPLEVWRQRQAT